MIRRCPQCGAATDDVYGFCIKCGCEFPKIPEGENACPLCGYPNPDEADYCVKCGTPLLFKSQFENTHNSIKPIVIKKETINGPQEYTGPKTSRIVIYLGYLFSLIGSLIGLLIGIYLITRKDPVAKKHGYIQIAIIIFYLVLLVILLKTGAIPPEIMNNYQQVLSGNFTSLQR